MRKPALIFHKERINKELDNLYGEMAKIRVKITSKEKELEVVEKVIKGCLCTQR